MKKIKYILSGIFIFFCLIGHGQEIFIKVSNIKGESLVRGHEDEIEALRFAQESSSCDFQTAGSGGGSCKITTSSFAFDMKINSGIIGLKEAMYRSTHIAKVFIVFRKPGSIPYEYYKINLENVIVSKMTDATDGNANICQVQFSAAKFFWTYIPIKSTGAPGTPVSFGWDAQANTVWDGR